MKRFLLLYIIPLALFAESGEDSLNRIVIHGLKRTRESAIHHYINIAPGDSVSSLDTEDLRKKILKTGLFKSVEISLQEKEGSTDLLIVIEERWSLFPVPLISLAPENNIFGAYVVDGNFLGRLTSLVAGGSYSTLYGWSGSLMYLDRHILPLDMGLYVQGSYTVPSKQSVTDVSGRVQGNYTLSFADGTVGLTRELGSLFSLFSTLSYKYYNVSESDSSLELLTGEYHVILNRFSISFDNRNPGKSVKTGGRASVSLTPFWFPGPGDFHINLDADMSYTHEIFSGLYINTGGTLSLFDKPVFQEEFIGSKTYSRTVYSLKTDEHIAGAAGLEWLALDFSFAAFSLSSYFEGGIYNKDGSSWYEYYGPGAGFRIYLKDIVFPAMGADIAMNLKTGEYITSISFGVGL